MSYEELNALVAGRKFNGRDRSILYSAMRLCGRDSGRCLAVVRGKGIFRATDSEWVNGVSESVFLHIRRKARREASKLVWADYSKLSAADQATHNEALSTLGAITLFTKDATRKVIADKVAKENAKLAAPSPESVLKLFA